MKWIIIGLSVLGLAAASLEPTGYSPLGSSPTSDQYLPPSYRDATPRGVLTPESHYLPPNHQSPSTQNVIPNSQYLPSNTGPSTLHNSISQSSSSSGFPPSQRYLPSRTSNRVSPNHHRGPGNPNTISNLIPNHVSSNLPPSTGTTQQTANRNNVPSQYLPPSQRPETFTQAIPSSTYLPSNQNQYSGGIQPPTSIVPPPSNTYLTPNKFSSTSTSGVSTHKDSHSVHLNPTSLSQPAGQYYPDSGYPNSEKNDGYQYDQPPVKYEFDYNVKDEYGNDYSHKESRDGDNTQGVYTVLLPDGRKQIVRYKADRDGYRPTITYEDAPSSGQSGYNQGYQY